MKITTIFLILTLIVCSTSFAKRLPPEPVPSIVLGDYEYIVPHFYRQDGTEKIIKGGYIQVLDVKSKEPVLAIQLYETNYDLALERDVQDIFITKMEINELGTLLTVTDELKRTYEINLRTREVLKID